MAIVEQHAQLHANIELAVDRVEHELHGVDRLAEMPGRFLVRLSAADKYCRLTFRSDEGAQWRKEACFRASGRAKGGAKTRGQVQSESWID